MYMMQMQDVLYYCFRVYEQKLQILLFKNINILNYEFLTCFSKIIDKMWTFHYVLNGSPILRRNREKMFHILWYKILWYNFTLFMFRARLV